MVTPAAKAAWKLARLRAMPAGSCPWPFSQPPYRAVASPAASVGPESYLMVRHHLEDFRRALVAMLDSFRAGKDGAPHAFGRSRVDCHGNARAFRRFDGQLHLFR